MQLLDDARKVVWQAEVAEPPSPKRELSPDGRQAGDARHGRRPTSRRTASPSADVLTAKVDAGKGWAVGPQQKEPHEAVFALKEPLRPRDDAAG